MSTITIKHVAARAGVSPKTVSRVINGEAHVRPELRETVMRVVDELNYRPNTFARGLSSARSFLIGMFFDDPTSGYAADIQRGALQRCRELSHHLLIEEIDPTSERWREQLAATLREVKLGGAILAPPLCDMPEVVDILRAEGVPVVRIAPGLSEIDTPQVRMDDRSAAQEMTRLLIDLGHRDIAFIKGRAGHSAAPLRLAGFEAAMADAGLPVADHLFHDGDFSFRSGLEAGDAILSAEHRPSAIFASNDEMALGVLVAAMRRGIAVPADLSVVGFDDAPIARMSWPQLTTIHQPKEEMAATAVDLLVGPAYREQRDDMTLCVELPYTLVRRPSSGPVD